jgi:hypothetical protein
MCGSCVDYDSSFLTQCDDCGALACPTHTHICRDCTTEPNRYLPPDNDVFGVRPLGSDGRRAMMQCCACKRTYCQACDPGRTGQAGDAGRATSSYDPEDEDVLTGCVFCCSWPRFCTGLARANMESLQRELDEQKPDTERAAAAAQDRAAAAAADATAAAVAATAADVAAHAAAASAHAAQEAAQEAALQEEELRVLQAQLDAAQAALP